MSRTWFSRSIPKSFETIFCISSSVRQSLSTSCLVNFKTQERIFHQPAFTNTDFDDLPEIADILDCGIVIAIFLGFQPELKIGYKFVIQPFDIDITDPIEVHVIILRSFESLEMLRGLETTSVSQSQNICHVSFKW
jgi:hypothetical protein